VPVRAIASGDVAVAVELLTPSGDVIGQPTAFDLQIRAGWENVGTALAAGGVALMLVAGIWRTVRRGKSDKRSTAKSLPNPPIYEPSK
jgi:hypothetical protein